MNAGKLLFLSGLAIGLGIFLGTVPLGDGLTAAEHGEAWFDGSAIPRQEVHRARRIGARPAAQPAKAQSASALRPAASPAAQMMPVPAAAPITAGAANSPEQTSASDKAALDRIISGRASGR